MNGDDNNTLGVMLIPKDVTINFPTTVTSSTQAKLMSVVFDQAKSRAYTIQEIRQLILHLGTGFENVRARSKSQLCDKLKTTLSTMIVKPSTTPTTTPTIVTNVSLINTESSHKPSHTNINNNNDDMMIIDSDTDDNSDNAGTLLLSSSPIPIKIPSQSPSTPAKTSFSLPKRESTTNVPFSRSMPVSNLDFLSLGRYPISLMTNHQIEHAFQNLYGRSWGLLGDSKTSEEDEYAKAMQASLLFGEVLPEGVSKLLDVTHLNASNATVLVDLGCGMGKLILQAFLQYTNLTLVVGIELCTSRFKQAMKSIASLAMIHPDIFSWSQSADGKSGTLTEIKDCASRCLKICCGDMFYCEDVKKADIVICETNVPTERQSELSQLLSQLKKNTRFMLYHSLKNLPGIYYDRLDNDKQKNGIVSYRLAPQTPPTQKSNQDDGKENADDTDNNYNNRRIEFQQISGQDSMFVTTWSSKGHQFDCWLKR